MTDGPQEQGILTDAAKVLERAHYFSHEAMATVFELYILCDNAGYASQAARAAFDEVDRLEQEMSRFVENSDIARLNIAAVGQEVQLGPDTFKALTIAQQIYEQTGGAFDVTVGSLFECWLDDDRKLKNPTPKQIAEAVKRAGMDKLIVDEEWLTGQVAVDGVRFDLGGIGKGCAADVMARTLREWSIKKALVLAGASTVLAVGRPDDMAGWPITLSNPLDRSETLLKLYLADSALGGSGIEQGLHIIDPRPGAGRPVKGKLAAWSLAKTGAEADALSTAFMVMSEAEIKAHCKKHPARAAMTVRRRDEGSNRITTRCFGHWPRPNHQ